VKLFAELLNLETVAVEKLVDQHARKIIFFLFKFLLLFVKTSTILIAFLILL
jgi:hypothetical protein